MTESEDRVSGEASDELVCSNCENIVEGDFDFCPHCGSILKDGIFCDKHSKVEADGVCVVCGVPCCDECGKIVNDLFLCARHADCEIFEGMVAAYSTPDDKNAQVAKSRLDDAGLHPVLLRAHWLSGVKRFAIQDYEVTDDSGNGVIKVMVPCEEVARADELLGTLLEP